MTLIDPSQLHALSSTRDALRNGESLARGFQRFGIL